VSATFRFHRVDDGRYRGLRLTVTLDRSTVFDRAARTAHCKVPFCIPGGGLQGKSVRVADLDGAGAPDVVLDLFTGGAHCCLESEVVALTGDDSVHRAQHDWGDAGYRLRDLDRDGSREFVSADDRFAYAFTAYAYSALPVQIWSFRGDRFADVTGSHRAAVRADARRWWRAYRRTSARAFPQGVLAAWAADRYRLGRRAQARAFVRAQARHGKLRAAMGARRATRFAAQLDRTLRRWGYAT
jgi:hypothetical protein